MAHPELEGGFFEIRHTMIICIFELISFPERDIVFRLEIDFGECDKRLHFPRSVHLIKRL